VSKDAEAMVDLRQWVDDNLAEGFQYKIFDRHRLISEFIYGPLLRDAQQPGFTDMTNVYHWMNRMAQIQPVIIYCIPPLEIVRANVLRDVENKVVHNRIDGMYTAYVHRAAIDLTGGIFNTIVYDYTQPGEDSVAIFTPFINYAKGRADLGF